MAESLASRFEQVEARLEQALTRAGRQRKEITIVAVTKLFPAAVFQQAYSLGLHHFGENYVQEFESKYSHVSSLQHARFHFIGHLQSNKARRATEIFHVLQTIDTPKLARRLNEAGKALDVMIEVKLAEEEAKAGAAPQEVPALIDAIGACPNLRLLGLMTMPPWSEDAEASRPYFRRLRELAGRNGLGGLSMGMSHDFEAAVEEGATMIRIGTALFGRRSKPA